MRALVVEDWNSKYFVGDLQNNKTATTSFYFNPHFAIKCVL